MIESAAGLWMTLETYRLWSCHASHLLIVLGLHLLFRSPCLASHGSIVIPQFFFYYTRHLFKLTLYIYIVFCLLYLSIFLDDCIWIEFYIYIQRRVVVVFWMASLDLDVLSMSGLDYRVGRLDAACRPIIYRRTGGE